MTFKVLLGGFGFTSLFVWAVVRIVTGINYDIEVGNYVEQAASSPSPSVAVEKLDRAIEGAQRRGLDHGGNTGIFFTKPENDIGFWYQRLIDSRDLLRTIPSGDDELRISNVMMRVHESLTGSGENGEGIRQPDGIAIYPNNASFFWWCVISIVLMLVGFGLAMAEDFY